MITVGTRVRLNKSLIGLPRNTEGVIDFVAQHLTWVSWDTPARPLPDGYDKWNAKAYLTCRFRRDAFEADEVSDLLTPLPTDPAILQKIQTPPDAAPAPESKGPSGPG